MAPFPHPLLQRRRSSPIPIDSSSHVREGEDSGPGHGPNQEHQEGMMHHHHHDYTARYRFRKVPLDSQSRCLSPLLISSVHHPARPSSSPQALASVFHCIHPQLRSHRRILLDHLHAMILTEPQSTSVLLFSINPSIHARSDPIHLSFAQSPSVAAR